MINHSKCTRPIRAALALGAITLVSALNLVDCAKTTTTPATNTFTYVYQNILATAGCENCHTAALISEDAPGTILDFSTQANAYTTLVGTAAAPTKVTGTNSASKCGTVDLVNTTTPANSYLLGIFTSPTPSNFAGASNCTPYVSPHNGLGNAATADVSAMTAWITAGALNN